MFWFFYSVIIIIRKDANNQFVCSKLDSNINVSVLVFYLMHANEKENSRTPMRPRIKVAAEIISVSVFCLPIKVTFPPTAGCFSKVHTRFKSSELRFHYFLCYSEEWLRLPELNVDPTVN